MLNRSLPCGLAAATLFSLTSSFVTAQNIVVDGDFGPDTNFNGNFGKTFDSDAGEGWHFPKAHRWNIDPVNGIAHVANPSGAGGLTQVILDSARTTGVSELSFVLANTEADLVANEFRFQVFGLNGPFEMSNWDSDSPAGATLLLDTGDLGGSNFPATEFVAAFDIGETGYPYLALRAFTKGVDPLAGDVLELDDISIFPTSDQPVSVSVAAVDTDTGESWPEPGAFVLRRTSNNGELVVHFTSTGNADLLADYRLDKGAVYDAGGERIKTSLNWIRPWNNTIVFPNGATELVVVVNPIVDSLTEGSAAEIAGLTLADGEGYFIDTDSYHGEILIWDEGVPTREEAVRFLLQASFGPGISWYNGAWRDDIEIVQELGFEGWIDWQLTQPARKLQSTFDALVNAGYDAGVKTKQPAFFHNMLGYAAPLGENAPRRPIRNYDPLRQRMAYALSQILVVSEKQNTLGNNAPGMIHYYDETLIENSFGNYRDVLLDVTTHPIMGSYLSHLRNRQTTFDDQGNELTNPDENYAREILQLFGIGTVELRRNGTPVTAPVFDENGDPVLDENGNQEYGAVGSYTNDEIVEFARVFTGLTFSDASDFNRPNGDFASFMKSIDFEFFRNRDSFYHDTGPKTLLSRSPVNQTLAPSDDQLVKGGVPYGQPSATHNDIAAAIDNIFYHPNVGPFIGRLLIQRLTISNPEPQYLAAVADAFNNTGGIRGDLTGVLKAILLHDHVRSFKHSNDERSGALREPWLRQLHLLRTLPVDTREDGFLGLYYLDNGLSQRPFASNSVFNFYLPDFVPPDAEAINSGLPHYAMIRGGLVAPEFQISTGGKLTKQLDFLTNTIDTGVNGFGPGPEYDLSRLYALADDPDALVAEIDLLLCAGRMLDDERKIITDTVRALSPDNHLFIDSNNEAEIRAKTALGLAVISPSFSVLR